MELAQNVAETREIEVVVLDGGMVWRQRVPKICFIHSRDCVLRRGDRSRQFMLHDVCARRGKPVHFSGMGI